MRPFGAHEKFSSPLHLSGQKVFLQKNKKVNMYTILSLFARSPFAPLQSHMDSVSQCVHKINDLFEALFQGKFPEVEKICETISELEHKADLTKNDIRNHLHKNIYLPIERSNLLEILSIQDSIADAAEDIAVLASLKKLEMPEEFREDFRKFLSKNIESFESARNIIKEMHDLLESSFGGHEAEKVKKMVDDVAYKEHEADVLQRKLLKALYNSEDKMGYSSFYLWQKIFQEVASISNLSEKLANRIRMSLDIK